MTNMKLHGYLNTQSAVTQHVGDVSMILTPNCGSSGSFSQVIATLVRKIVAFYHKILASFVQKHRHAF